MWTKDELDIINKEDALYISIPNNDGTMHNPTYIWGVSSNGDFYARGASGVNSKWHKAALMSKKGHINIGIVEKDVTIEFPNDINTKKLVDNAFRTKYNSVLDLMTSDLVSAATVKLIPIEK